MSDVYANRLPRPAGPEDEVTLRQSVWLDQGQIRRLARETEAGVHSIQLVDRGAGWVQVLVLDRDIDNDLEVIGDLMLAAGER